MLFLFDKIPGNSQCNVIHQENLICVIKLIRGLTFETGRQHLDYCEILDTTWSGLMINKLQSSVRMLTRMFRSFICIYTATKMMDDPEMIRDSPLVTCDVI